MKQFNDDISIVICGEAGQGIQTVEKLLTGIFKEAGYNVFATKEYMSRIRGGSNSTQLRITSKRVSAFVNKIDLLIPLDQDAIPHLAHRITKDTIIVGEKEKINTNLQIIDVPISKYAQESGGAIYSNTVAVALILGLFKVDKSIIEKYLSDFFSKKTRDIIDNNLLSAQKGYEAGLKILETENIEINISTNPSVKSEILISGIEALSLGCLAGGCDFISAYPMTPSTGVITFLSEHASDAGIIAEQAEDEISAINMAIGAWYAGARAMVSTAGGGFALMCEGVSLAGMIESPLVINVGQRPAPATGLPTRTEQGNLNLVLYSGHGEFPRIIFAPKDITDAFHLAQKAFNLADKFQVPVFLLTDQYLADSYGNIPNFDISKSTIERYVVKTNQDYKRYSLTKDGISPRGIPDFGEGVVALDSDEHDETGRITESESVRVSMVNKRLKKYEKIKKEIIEPVFEGEKKYSTLIIGWGSTYGAIKEALDVLKSKNMAMLHFSQVHPLHPSTKDYLLRAKKIIVVENNATGQFANLLKLETGIDAHKRILKYSGMPFSVEELAKALK
ncbi:MAG: 2-oxoacid:acceptor oxidoreductase subunit alpha [Elusimicrobia bacterium]|nr:2-oxoacid:acceptor oxidoreductase subunit alpha [Elusimicrobiota bacterium]